MEVKELSFIEVANTRARLCRKFFMYVNCAGCPLAELKEKYCGVNSRLTCPEFIMEYPTLVLVALSKYNNEHPENPTWHQWLNAVYNYYKGTSQQTFTEWLDTEITEEEARHFNIPNKEQLKL